MTYLETAEHFEHQRALVSLELERREGTGMVDTHRDDWMVCRCGSEEFMPDGSCATCGEVETQ